MRQAKTPTQPNEIVTHSAIFSICVKRFKNIFKAPSVFSSEINVKPEVCNKFNFANWAVSNKKIWVYSERASASAAALTLALTFGTGLGTIFQCHHHSVSTYQLKSVCSFKSINAKADTWCQYSLIICKRKRRKCSFFSKQRYIRGSSVCLDRTNSLVQITSGAKREFSKKFICYVFLANFSMYTFHQLLIVFEWYVFCSL